MELQDLEKTLKNIQEARPFEDLTVVCSAGYIGVDGWWLTFYFRTKLPPPAQISTREPPSSSPRDAGAFQATRYVKQLLKAVLHAEKYVLIQYTGEIRRLVCALNVIELPFSTSTVLL